MTNPANIPPKLKERKQWVFYRSDKKPRNPHNNQLASVSDLRTWDSFENACKAVKDYKGEGVGFVFTENDDLCGIDLDKCIDENGQIDPEKQTIIDKLDSFTEISRSETGIHIIVEAEKPKGSCKMEGIEVYDEGRYFALTGNLWQDRGIIQSRQSELDSFYEETLGAEKPKSEPITTLIYEGEGRNNACTKEAGRLLNIYKDPEIVKPMIWAYNQQVCVPPLEKDECAETWEKSLAKWAKKAKIDEPETDEPLKLNWIKDVQSRQIDWLWKPYIPMGCLSMMDGDPGEGKSLITLWIAKSVSLGELDLPEPRRTIIATLEDDEPTTIKPRLETIGANMSQIATIDKDQPFILDDKGFNKLEDVMAEHRPALVVFDPILGYIGQKDMNKASEMRSITAQLRRLASDYECAILGIRHITKPGGGLASKAIYRGLGSIDIIAAARSGLLVGHTEDDDGSLKERVMMHVKHNLSVKGETQNFEIMSVNDAPFVSWLGVSAISARDVLGLSSKGTKVQAAIDLIKRLLEDGQPVLATAILEQGQNEGISERTMREAKERIGTVAAGKQEGAWYWSMPVKSSSKVKVDHLPGGGLRLRLNLDEL